MISQNLGRSVLAAAALVCIAAGALAQVPTAKHVVLVINENTSYSDVMANMPWLAGHHVDHSESEDVERRTQGGSSRVGHLGILRRQDNRCNGSVAHSAMSGSALIAGVGLPFEIPKSCNCGRDPLTSLRARPGAPQVLLCSASAVAVSLRAATAGPTNLLSLSLSLSCLHHCLRGV